MSVRVEALREAASALEQERESIMEMIQAIQTGQEMRNICPGEAAPRHCHALDPLRSTDLVHDKNRHGQLDFNRLSAKNSNSNRVFY